MSKMNQLKELNPKLRSAMARRDAARKHVSKHANGQVAAAKTVTRLTEQNKAANDAFNTRLGKLTQDISMHESYEVMARAVLKELQGEVDALIKSTEAAMPPPTKPVKGPTTEQVQSAKEETETERFKGNKERDANREEVNEKKEEDAKAHAEGPDSDEEFIPQSKRARRQAKRKARLAEQQAARAAASKKESS
jgi:hypothetical protein